MSCLLRAGPSKTVILSLSKDEPSNKTATGLSSRWLRGAGAVYAPGVAARAGRAVPVGVSRQLVGEHAFGAAGYRYCGNILAAAGDAQFARDEALVDAAC